MSETRLRLILDYDVNNPPNASGNYEVWLPDFMASNFHTDDEVILRDGDDSPPLIRRGRIIGLFAVVEPIDPTWLPADNDGAGTDQE